MAEKEQIDDLVSMLDNFMEKGGGHMNVDADQLQETTVQTTTQCNECSTGKWATACAVPTLMEGLDVEDDEKDS